MVQSAEPNLAARRPPARPYNPYDTSCLENPESEARAGAPPRCQRRFVVSSRVGLHLRPATMLVRTACRFQSEVIVTHNDLAANGKSLLSVILLGANFGAEVAVFTEGADAQEAMESITALFDRCFSTEPRAATVSAPGEALPGALSRDPAALQPGKPGAQNCSLG